MVQYSNKVWPASPGQHIDVRKVPADSVPYGGSISRNGRTVWAAFDAAGRLVCVAATANEARRKYRLAQGRAAQDNSYVCDNKGVKS